LAGDLSLVGPLLLGYPFLIHVFESVQNWVLCDSGVEEILMDFAWDRSRDLSFINSEILAHLDWRLIIPQSFPEMHFISPEQFVRNGRCLISGASDSPLVPCQIQFLGILLICQKQFLSTHEEYTNV
jgi:hypothetical protein